MTPPHANHAKAPTSLTLRSYNVGFGDCYLLTFAYAGGGGGGRADRHVLIDFGSNAPPKGRTAGELLAAVADDIRAECGGKLHAVVLTHRHKDHIAGFTTAANGRGPGDVIAALEPDLVVQPWTEDPDARTDATVPTRRGFTGDDRGFARALEHMHDISAGVTAEAQRLARTEAVGSQRRFYQTLRFLGEEGIKNRSAVENLQRMGARDGADAEYVNHGYRSKLNALLPGVTVTVLGPPTLKQSDAIRKERAQDADEFWMLQANAGRYLARLAGRTDAGGAAPGAARRLFAGAETLPADAPPPYARWFIPKLRAIRGANLLEIVRILDDAMNNTSVILLFEVKGAALLFPGDAQIENWKFTLDRLATDADLKRRLAGVTLYKVGHHGSRNATPKTLWANFERRGPPGKKGRLQTFVSTMAGVYGKSEGAEVPRATLVKALKAETDFFSTQSLKANELKRVAQLELD
jgi:hypothetical protein